MAFLNLYSVYGNGRVTSPNIVGRYVKFLQLCYLILNLVYYCNSLGRILTWCRAKRESLGSSYCFRRVAVFNRNSEQNHKYYSGFCSIFSSRIDIVGYTDTLMYPPETYGRENDFVFNLLFILFYFINLEDMELRNLNGSTIFSIK